MDGTILGQGSFVVPSTLTNQLIQIPSAADWVNVYNYTQFGTTQGAFNVGVQFYWQRGMAPGTGIVKYYADGGTPAALIGDTLLSGGFTIYDPSTLQTGSQPRLGNPVATTASTNVTRPVVSTGNTAGLSVGSVVRLSNTAQTDVNGIDFVVGAVTANTSFTLLTATNPLATAPGAIGGAGFYRIVYYPPLYYPARKIITRMTQANGAAISCATEHSLTVGQAIRFNIPVAAGMTQLNPTPQNNYLYATVTALIDSYNFYVDTNTSSFSAFTWPTIAQMPSSFPSFEPIGMNTSVEQSILLGVYTPLYQGNAVFNANSGVFADATINTGYYGMILGTGGLGNLLGAAISGPAGDATGDVIYWTSGKSDFGGL